MTAPDIVRIPAGRSTRARLSLLAALVLLLPAGAKKMGSDVSAPPAEEAPYAQQEAAEGGGADGAEDYEHDEHRALEALAGGDDDSATKSKDLGDDLGRLDDFERQLQQREERMRGQGVWLAHLDGPAPERTPDPFPGMGSPRKDDEAESKSKSTKKKKSTSTSKRPSSKPVESAPASDPAGGAGATTSACSVVCDLATTTCDLEQKICALAERHQDEPRYGQVCERAQSDCRVAKSACSRCSGC